MNFKTKHFYLIIFFSFFFLILYGQENGNILLIPESNCTVIINGDKEIDCIIGEPYKIQLPFGEHFIQATNDKEKISKVVELTDSKQKVVKLTFSGQSSTVAPKSPSKTKSLESILISDQEIQLLGGINELDPEIEILTEDNHQFYYLAKGDKIKLNGVIKNKKGKFSVKLFSYPDLNVIFSKTKLRELNHQIIDIRQEGIFILELISNAMLDKTLDLKVERIPVSKEFIDFNTTVEKRYRYEAVDVGQISQYVNSTSNDAWRGGNSELVVPVNIPPDAIEWYYSFAASRNPADLKQGQNNVSLFKQVTKTVAGLSPTTAVLNLGLNIFTAPPGADYCDVYLLDYPNSINFKNNAQFSYIIEGSRKNLKSSTIDIKCCNDKPYYVGIKNNDLTAGVHVSLEVVAIKRIQYLAHKE